MNGTIYRVCRYGTGPTPQELFRTHDRATAHEWKRIGDIALTVQGRPPGVNLRVVVG